jgi:hypothetical protein
LRRIRKYLMIFLLVIGAVLVGIQFIQPSRNSSQQILAEDFSNVYDVPANVRRLLKIACYDCHSNNTNYPWYAAVQPVAWLLDCDVRDGKDKLNFSEFGTYSGRLRVSKLRGINNGIKDATMPLPSYLLLHPEAKLAKQDVELITDWIERVGR